MGFDEELDPQSEPAGSHAVHLLRDSVPQVQPQVLSFTAGELQAKIVHFYDTQLPTYLQQKKKKNTKQRHSDDDNIM